MSQVERGKYLVSISACDDCHTPNYGLSGGKVPEKDWLTGDSLGWQGPWGTTYAPNLRLFFQSVGVKISAGNPSGGFSGLVDPVLLSR